MESRKRKHLVLDSSRKQELVKYAPCLRFIQETRDS